MENKKIVYRCLKSTDYKQLEKILNKTWNFKNYSHRKFIVKLIAKYDFQDYFLKSNHSIVASLNGRPIGILLSRVEGEEPFSHNFAQKIRHFFTGILLTLFKGGRKYLREERKINKSDKMLRKKHKRKYGAELVLFVVNKHYHGLGIGRELMKRFQKFLRRKKINTYYLFTDEYCDVDFYTKKQYTQLGCVELKFNNNERARFYLFSYNIKKIAHKLRLQKQIG